jgi:hypothetical protein
MGWLIGLGVGALVVIAVVAVVMLAIRDTKRKNQVIAEGDHSIGWLVQANSNLYEDGFLDYPGVVLISPDEETANDEAFMTGLAERIMELKGADPADCDDKDEAVVARLMSDETYLQGQRDKLPKRFANGRTVYLAHIFIYRDHLPKQRIEGASMPVALFWNDPKSLVCTRPAPAKKKPRRDKDDK